MQLSHGLSRVRARFDDPNLVSCAGLAPVLALGERAGLSRLVAERLTLSGPGAAHGDRKITALVAGMLAGADSIDDMDLLRHGGMDRLFAGVRAPSTLGTFLRCFTFGHVRQLDAVAAGLLGNLAGLCPLLVPAASGVVFVDVDDTMRETHGYAKQGVAYGYNRVKGLNALVATLSTPTSAPVIAATRLRKGATNSARGAHHLLAAALAGARGAGVDPRAAVVIARMDSAFYTAKMIAAARRAGARFSVTARMNPAVAAAIAGIDADAWTPIHYPNAFADPDTGELTSDAEVAEVEVFTAFSSRPRAEQVTGRLIVRRVRRLGPRTDTGEQSELFAVWRYHAVFTDSPMTMLQAEAQHRGHAIIEQVIADLKSGPMAHLPSGKFWANSAWLVCAAMAFNLTRAAGTLASAFHAKATTATIRAQLIAVPARLARTARNLILHLPLAWPWQSACEALFTAATHPPPAAA
jgi:hypothetical protein